ncbi:NAD-dependent epimerase [Muricauda ruestringensis]|jgi:UDP-glucuronate 4-epimerase|uniref:NAD-dependent epimerase n=1 Tax=Flagellimonas marinaquae TaxID=254955 RepID=A0AA48HSY5_9FLAO|nr:NAD-dependent epimerase [Allomuricauda ruestringensis]MCA0959882.1 NAD-dependent epimerase [Allomuricauda ruestringensis]BDW93821.1 NAD-dependent epimerase [Allomuricauda aquimarina]
MQILVTGAAGFIGFHTSKALLELGYSVIGLDNINDYYDTKLKTARLKELGVFDNVLEKPNEVCQSSTYPKFSFVKLDITDRENLPKLFSKHNIGIVCHLAAQAGVRYSIENPEAYIDSNIVGFLNILECCRNFKIKHLLYASSSSVYGNNKSIPFKTTDNVDHPVSLYAATKKSNELMAHTYSHLYDIPTTGLRFFTVYGPWGRPDMAMFLFTDAILKGKPIKVFNHGNMERDFTYIDDIVTGIVHIIEGDLEKRLKFGEKYKVYNIGNNQSVKLTDFIKAIEEELGTTAQKELLPMQDGDVPKTWADVKDLMNDFNYRPNTSIKKGVASFVSWYKNFYGYNHENP